MIKGNKQTVKKSEVLNTKISRTTEKKEKVGEEKEEREGERKGVMVFPANKGRCLFQNYDLPNRKDFFKSNSLYKVSKPFSVKILFVVVHLCYSLSIQPGRPIIGMTVRSMMPFIWLPSQLSYVHSYEKRISTILFPNV